MDVDYPAGPEIQQPLPEIDMTQNHLVWKLISTFGDTMHS